MELKELTERKEALEMEITEALKKFYAYCPLGNLTIDVLHKDVTPIGGKKEFMIEVVAELRL